MQTKGMHKGVLGKITTITFWDLWHQVEIRPQVIESNGHTWWGLTVFKISGNFHASYSQISKSTNPKPTFGELQMWLDLLSCCPPKLITREFVVRFIGTKAATVHGSEIRHPPVEVGSLFHYLWDFYASPVVVSRGMSHQRSYHQSTYVIECRAYPWDP